MKTLATILGLCAMAAVGCGDDLPLPPPCDGPDQTVYSVATCTYSDDVAFSGVATCSGGSDDHAIAGCSIRLRDARDPRVDVDFVCVPTCGN